MMIIEKARLALEKLRRTNYKQNPDFGLDEITEELISIIANECKSTVIDENCTIRYGSDIVRENIDAIIRQLIINGAYIPKDVMNKIINAYNDKIVGVNSDITIYKGVEEAEDGSMKRRAVTGNCIINVNTLDAELLSEIKEKIYKRFARQLVLKNLDEFPKQNSFSVFKERLLHGRENRKTLEKIYIKILQEHTEYNDEIIKNTVEYNLDYMYDEVFGDDIIESINDGSNLQLLEVEKNKNKLSNLFMSVSTEIEEMMNIIPDLNQISNDISQIYSDVEAQLIAYSTDITKLNSNQIEDTIKEINKASLQDKKLQEHLGNNGYRTSNLGISGNTVELLDENYVQYAMSRISDDIYDLIQNVNDMDKEEYLRKAVALQYRFIRIHPFPDSNGRTSRALLNMMTIPKGILVNFSKNNKNSFYKESNKTHMIMDEKDYLQAITNNAENLNDIENETNIPLYEYIKNNCIISIKSENQENDIESKEISEEKER